MSHDHHHHHDHTIHHASKALVIGIVLNIVFVVVEAIAGFSSGSLSLLTDAGHNLSDVASLALALLAFGLAKSKPTDNYTYGYRKTTILVALLNAVILLIAIGGIGFEAVQRLSSPEKLPGKMIAIVAGVGIVINAITAFLFIKDKDKDLNIKGAYLHMAADALVSIGVVIGGVLMTFTGWYWLDSVLSFIIMIVILIGTWRLLMDSLRLSLDGVPKEIDLDEVRRKSKQVEGVRDIHHLHVWAISTQENAMTAHIVVDPSSDFQEISKIKQRLKHTLEHLDIKHCTFEIETPAETCGEEICAEEKV